MAALGPTHSPRTHAHLFAWLTRSIQGDELEVGGFHRSAFSCANNTRRLPRPELLAQRSRLREPGNPCLNSLAAEMRRVGLRFEDA